MYVTICNYVYVRFHKIYYFSDNKKCLLDIATNLNSNLPQVKLKNINLGKVL
jgi:hypothetical protein